MIVGPVVCTCGQEAVEFFAHEDRCDVWINGVVDYLASGGK